ncbi:MAG: hypothetical protein M3O09_05225 [Acidobacteriota bacterium]|nr:hypothetical protein [Acidobacteriota bacterium]
MTKNDVIEKTLREAAPRMATYELPYDDGIDEDEVIIAELDSRLPDTDLKTCSDFAHLGVNCCETCHKFYPEYEMSVIRLPDGETAWVCDPVKDALNVTIPK